MEFSWRRVIEVLLIAAAFFVVQIALSGVISAEEDASIGSYIIETIEDVIADTLGTPEPIAGTLPIVPYIYQGDKVYLNTTIDVSGVVPPYPMLAYWDGFDMYDSAPSYNLTMPDNDKGYYKFWVDPEIFGTRLGRWYKYEGKYEPQGNNIAFVVVPYSFGNYTVRYPNGTLVNVSSIQELVTYIKKPVLPEPPLLPERHESDYIVAKGDPLVWEDSELHLWIFGRVSRICDYHGHIIPAETIETLENGNYKVVVHRPGNNTLYEARYENDTLYPGLYGKVPVSTFGDNPELIHTKLKAMLADTDDVLTEYSLVVDIPSVTIRQADEVKRQGVDYLDIRGYTNTRNGTRITVTLNEKDKKGFDGWSEAIRTSAGNLSYYRVYVPFDWDELAADARNHTLIARTALGGYSSKDFKVSVMPADSFKPNASLKYIEDRNPFIPTPTPLIVEKIVTKNIISYVTVPVTPSNEQVYAQQKLAEDAKWGEFFTMALFGLACVVAAVAGFYTVKYLHGLYRRKKECEKDEKWKP